LNSIVTLKSELEVTQGHSKWYQKLGCGFLFAFHCKYGSILHQFRGKYRYWSKVVIFSYPIVFGTPVRKGEVPVGIVPSLLVRKITTIVGLPDGEKTFRICVTVYTQYWRVTDRQTDILPWHSPRYAYASHGKTKSTCR